jgi:hypothetical protein
VSTDLSNQSSLLLHPLGWLAGPDATGKLSKAQPSQQWLDNYAILLQKGCDDASSLFPNPGAFYSDKVFLLLDVKERSPLLGLSRADPGLRDYIATSKRTVF